MMLFEVGDEVRVRQPTNLFHSELGKVVSIDHVKLTYKVVFHRGGSDVYTCFDLILVKRQEEKVMKFKVGDKVKVSNSWEGRSGEFGEITRRNVWGAYPWRVTFEDGIYESFKEEELELVKEEEKVMKFKVGDRVQVVATYSGFYGDKGNVTENDGTDNLPVKVRFDDGEHVCWFYEDDLKVLHEEEKVMEFKVGDKVRMIRNTYGHRGKIGTLEKIDTSTMPYCVVFDDGRKEWCYGHEFKLLMGETSMKFKVGDKVKVKDSWFGFTGEVGLIVRIDGPAKYPYQVKFDVVDEEDKELFAEGSLELVKGKQSFTKSDLKTGMGVVLRNGDKAHVLLGTDDGDVMRFLEKDTWDTLKSANEDLTWKGMDNFDIVEVYSTKLASRYLTDMVFEEKCVFKREEPKPEPEPTKMTMKEINEHFGKPIEIVE